MAGGIFGRAFSYMLNEMIVTGLANNQAFQRFAVRTSKRLENVKDIANKTKEEVAEQVKQFSKNMEQNAKY